MSHLLHQQSVNSGISSMAKRKHCKVMSLIGRGCSKHSLWLDSTLLSQLLSVWNHKMTTPNVLMASKSKLSNSPI